MGERIKMRDFVVTAGLLFLFFTFTLSEESDDTEKRAGKIFYVTTTSSISTVSTATFCFVQETQSYIPLTCGKKKRAVKVISDKSAEDLDIHPSSIYPEEDNEEIESEVVSSQGEDRKGKFVNYWITTTFTSTTTSYTSTLSIATVECTPVGWTYVQCPAGKK